MVLIKGDVWFAVTVSRNASVVWRSFFFFLQNEWSGKNTGFDSYCVYSIEFAIHYRHVCNMTRIIDRGQQLRFGGNGLTYALTIIT